MFCVLSCVLMLVVYDDVLVVCCGLCSVLSLVVCISLFVVCCFWCAFLVGCGLLVVVCWLVLARCLLCVVCV